MPRRHGGRVTSTALEPSYERVCRWEQVGVTVERIVGGPDVRRSRPIIVAEERSDASENRMIPIGDEQRCWVESAPPDWAEYRVFGTRALDQYHRSGWWCHPLATAENSPVKTQRNSCRSVIFRESLSTLRSAGDLAYTAAKSSTDAGYQSLVGASSTFGGVTVRLMVSTFFAGL
jgi:hypothetical protein